MHYACSVGNEELIRSLLHRGALACVRNSFGQFPLDIAREKQFVGCVELLERVTRPPSSPIIDKVQKNPQNDCSLVVCWHIPETRNYYPVITAAEFQLKQQRLFDTWKTVDTIQVGKSVFKEAVARSTYSFSEGEATDVEDEEDQLDRSQVEMICASFMEQSNTLEHRIEDNREENRIQNYYELMGLNQRQVYQVRMRCANKFGWSEYSHGMTFCPKDSISLFSIIM